MADILSYAPSAEVLTPNVQPARAEGVTQTLTDGFRARAEALFTDSNTRTLEPSYWIQTAGINHTDPTRRLIATQDRASNTSFLIESSSIEGTTEDKYMLIRWEKTDPHGVETGTPHGWIRIIHEKGKVPHIAMATEVGLVHQTILVNGEYAEGSITQNEAVELSPEAIQDVLVRLQNSQVNPELTEKVWQQAEKQRLRINVSYANYLLLAAVNEYVKPQNEFVALLPFSYRKRDKELQEVKRFKTQTEETYRRFLADYNFPGEIPEQLTQEELDKAVTSYEAWSTSHPQFAQAVRQRDAMALNQWFEVKNQQKNKKGKAKDENTEEQEQAKTDKIREALEEELASVMHTPNSPTPSEQ